MSIQPSTPLDIDMVEMSKLDTEINWLVAFVNRKLKEGSRDLSLGRATTVLFAHEDFMHSYAHLYYWRDYAEEIAALFREQGWQVTVSEPKAYFNTEQQPYLTFKLVEASE